MEVPNILYKYTSLETAILLLTSGKLRWSSPDLFNDPNELQRMPVFQPSLEEGWSEYLHHLIRIASDKSIQNLTQYSDSTQFLIKLLRLSDKSGKANFDLLGSQAAPFQKQMEDSLRRLTEYYNDGSLRIFCLTENTLNDAMWAHYASNYTGCVLGFKHLPELNTPFLAAEQVKYTEGPPVVGSAVDFYLYGENEDLNKKTRLAIYYTKSIHWSYEKEWRVLTRRPNAQDLRYSDFKFYPDELESIIIGPKATSQQLLAIKQLLTTKYPSCKIYNLESSNGELKLSLNG